MKFRTTIVESDGANNVYSLTATELLSTLYLYMRQAPELLDSMIIVREVEIDETQREDQRSDSIGGDSGRRTPERAERIAAGAQSGIGA